MVRPVMRGNVGRGVALAVLLALGISACTAQSPPPPAPAAAYRYVALGDSWAAGPLMTLPTSDPIFCGRSATNYPSQLASRLGVDQFVDVTCGSADTKDVTEAQEVDPLDLGVDLGEAAPQADALTRDTDLVTVTMGGNDVGLPKFAIGCANLFAVRLGPPPFGQPCTEILTEGGVDQVSEEIDATRPKVVAMLREIRRRAPKAAIFLVGYPAGLPQGGTGCWGRWPILDVDAGYLDQKMQEMNAMLASAARRAGVRFVDAYTSSIGHDACQPADRAWVNGISFAPDGIPLHPNSRSASNTANVVAAAVRQAGVAPG